MITSTGSAVGIAQPSPSYTLDVTGTGRFTSALTMQGNINVENNFVLNLGSNQGGGATLKYNSNGNLDITPRSGFSTVFTAGNVGIGTSSPNQKLEVYGVARLTNASVTSQYLDLYTSSAISYFNAYSNSAIYTAYQHIFQYSGTEAMRVASDGKVGIGTSSPSYTLTVNGGIYGSYLRQNSRSPDGGTTMYTGSTGGSLAISNGTNTVTINRYVYSGFAGFIANNSEFYGICNDHEYGGPGAQLSIVAGTTTGTIAFFVGNPTSQPNGAYAAPKVSYINSSGTYIPLSDKNKKKDFEVSNIGLNEVLKLKPTLFRMKFEDESSQKQLGFIAQEVREIIPQAYAEDGSFIGLQDRPIIAALVKAIQEQQQQIDELKLKIK